MNIITTIVDALSSFVTASASAIGTGVEGLLTTTNGTDGRVLSTAGIVIFTLFGLGLATGLMHLIIGIFTR